MVNSLPRSTGRARLCFCSIVEYLLLNQNHRSSMAKIDELGFVFDPGLNLLKRSWRRSFSSGFCVISAVPCLLVFPYRPPTASSVTIPLVHSCPPFSAIDSKKDLCFQMPHMCYLHYMPAQVPVTVSFSQKCKSHEHPTWILPHIFRSFNRCC